MGGFGIGGSRSKNRPKPIMQEDLKGLRESLGSYFSNMLRNPSALSSPTGIIGSQYNALFGGGSEAGLGTHARQALESVLGGGAFRNTYNDVMDLMTPNMNRGMELINRNVLGRNTVMGKRFSSDVGNQASSAAANLLLGTQREAMGNALNFANMRGSLGANVMGGIGSLAEGQFARQLPLLVQYAMGFAPVGNYGNNRSYRIGYGSRG